MGSPASYPEVLARPDAADTQDSKMASVGECPRPWQGYHVSPRALISGPRAALGGDGVAEPSVLRSELWLRPYRRGSGPPPVAAAVGRPAPLPSPRAPGRCLTPHGRVHVCPRQEARPGRATSSRSHGGRRTAGFPVPGVLICAHRIAGVGAAAGSRRVRGGLPGRDSSGDLFPFGTPRLCRLRPPPQC